MKNYKPLLSAVISFLLFVSIDEIADLLNLSLLGNAIIKITYLVAWGILIKIQHPQLLKKALLGKPRNILLLLLLVPNLLLYSSGFDVQAIFTAMNIDHWDSLFQFQRLFLNAALEEMLFRIIWLYAFLSALQHCKHKIIMALLLSSVVFGLAHLNNLEYIGLRTSLLQSYGAFALGFLMAVLYLKTNNIFIITIAHFLINYASHFASVSQSATSATATTASHSTISLIFTLLIFAIPLGLGLLILKYHRKDEFYIYHHYRESTNSTLA